MKRLKFKIFLGERDKILAKCSSSDIYVEYCGYLGKKYNSNLSAEEIFKLRREISNKFKLEIDYKENADKLLKQLKEKGFKLVLATTTTKSQLDIYRFENKNIISKANFDDIFDAKFCKEDVTEKKPNPEVHKKIMQLFNVKPEECLILEDSLIGTQAGSNAGIDVAVMYDKYSDGDREKINELAKYQFNNFNEIIKIIKEEM